MIVDYIMNFMYASEFPIRNFTFGQTLTQRQINTNAYRNQVDI